MGKISPGQDHAFFDMSMTVGFCRYGMCFMAATSFSRRFDSDTASFLKKIKRNGGFDFSKAAASKRACEKTSAERRLFSFAVVRQIRFIIKERADNSSSIILLVIGSASVRLALL
ncbi:hypothetical protein [Parablautia intestinalis]|uniref:hypothetical protein n=1 Tax=Parablautia intestinalis TaxID=2320100 RepID=UPI002412439E|nr:hypothetical protein [Parablautia intestinalis]